MTITEDTTAPIITSGTTGTDLAENSGSGKTVYTVAATDALGVTSYAIGGDDIRLLRLAGEVVTLNDNPDYETKSSYSFTVTASDAAGNASAATTVTFSITNVDEVAPTITTSTTGNDLAENSGAGQTVYTITADANDGGTISSYAIAGITVASKYDMTSSGYGYFNISWDGSSIKISETSANNTFLWSGVLRYIGNQTFESEQSTSSSSDGKTFEFQNLNNGVYDNILLWYGAEFARASDADNVIIYSDDGALLSVDPSTGVVKLTADPDYETKNSYSFSVTATDAAGTSNTKTVTFSITNVDEVLCQPSLLVQLEQILLRILEQGKRFILLPQLLMTAEPFQVTQSVERTRDFVVGQFLNGCCELNR